MEANGCKQAVWDTFHECPNEKAAAAAAALYAFMTVASLAVTVKTRAWFMLFVPITGALESIGFGMRIAYTNDPAYIKLVIMQCFLIIPPVLLAICDYVCVGRLLSLTDPAKHPPAMRRFARWVAAAYTASDFFCLALQGGGGGMLASNNVNTISMGTNLLLAGLALQLAFFSSFTLITIYVHSSPRFGLRGDRSLTPVWIALYSTIVLMFGRNIFRVIEFAQGWFGYLATHEMFLYVFDVMLILGCFIFFTVLHFGFFLGPEALKARLLQHHQPPPSPLPSEAMSIEVKGGGRTGSGDLSATLPRKGSVLGGNGTVVPYPIKMAV